MDTTSSTAMAPSNALFTGRMMDDCTAGMSTAVRNRDISNKNPATAMAAESRVIDFVLLSCGLTPLLSEPRKHDDLADYIESTIIAASSMPFKAPMLDMEQYKPSALSARFPHDQALLSSFLDGSLHKGYHYSARYFPSRVRTIAISRGSQLDLERKWKWSLKRAKNPSKYRDNHELEQSTKPIEYPEADSNLENDEDVWSALDLSTEPRVTTIVKIARPLHRLCGSYQYKRNRRFHEAGRESLLTRLSTDFFPNSAARAIGAMTATSLVPAL
ncbi:MAG: hypothetical protein J3R72DRAFT_522718 [Linnemannia gamsii]|nr:MAG: hypothetical protein J3R72DRAFT_522718 [Linnemannia gamsii]